MAQMYGKKIKRHIFSAQKKNILHKKAARRIIGRLELFNNISVRLFQLSEVLDGANHLRSVR